MINKQNNVFIMDHPLIQHKVTLLRNKTTGSKDFREVIREITMLMCYEATRDLPLEEISIETPLIATKAKAVCESKLVFIPILRAGIGMVDGILKLVPAAKVGHIGLYRNPVTLSPIEYFNKLPCNMEKCDAIILDPMLATGGSATDAIYSVKKHNPKSIKFMCIIAASKGISVLSDAHPDVKIYCAEKDEKLDSHGYIVPGLGDAGDRLFGTK